VSKGGRAYGTWGKTLHNGQLYGGKKKRKRSKRNSDDFHCLKADLKKAIRNATEDFFLSRDWQTLRYQALRMSNGRCELCGRGKPDGVTLHVDHIKPRSKYPHLALELTNLQILCADCNMGKGNRCTRDWRNRPTADELAAVDDWSRLETWD
jgi:5-methylcytosine-specific restriction endonuclease McrA